MPPHARDWEPERGCRAKEEPLDVSLDEVGNFVQTGSLWSAEREEAASLCVAADQRGLSFILQDLSRCPSSDPAEEVKPGSEANEASSGGLAERRRRIYDQVSLQETSRYPDVLQRESLQCVLAWPGLSPAVSPSHCPAERLPVKAATRTVLNPPVLPVVVRVPHSHEHSQQESHADLCHPSPCRTLMVTASRFTLKCTSTLTQLRCLMYFSLT